MDRESQKGQAQASEDGGRVEGWEKEQRKEKKRDSGWAEAPGAKGCGNPYCQSWSLYCTVLHTLIPVVWLVFG